MQGEGGGATFDPTDNDRDPDAEDGRQVALSDADFALLMHDGEPVTGSFAQGETRSTQQGGTLTRVGDDLVYRPYADLAGGVEFGLLYGYAINATEDLPFFGFDRVDYTVRNAEEEISHVASIDFLVRPETLDLAGNPGLPEVIVRSPDADKTVMSLALTTWAADAAQGSFSGPGMTDRPWADVAYTEDAAYALGGNDLLVVEQADLGLLDAGSGHDVMISKTPGSVVFDGGSNADWVEGGDDFLTGGAKDDLINAKQFRTDPYAAGALDPATPQANIVLGGGGDNVFALGRDTGDYVYYGETPLRDTIFVLDGDKDLIIGVVDLAQGAGARPMLDPLYASVCPTPAPRMQPCRAPRPPSLRPPPWRAIWFTASMATMRLFWACNSATGRRRR